MLYLGIDQHKRQLTVNLRGEDGSVILQRQVSTQWEKVRAFFADLAEKAGPEGGFLAILEVCGMNDWPIAATLANWLIRCGFIGSSFSTASIRLGGIGGHNTNS